MISFAENLSIFNVGIGSNFIHYFTEKSSDENNDWDISLVGNLKAGKLFDNNLYFGGEIAVGGMLNYTSYPTTMSSLSAVLNIGYVWNVKNSRWSFYTGVHAGVYTQIGIKRKIVEDNPKEQPTEFNRTLRYDGNIVTKDFYEKYKKNPENYELDKFKYNYDPTNLEKLETNGTVVNFVGGVDLIAQLKVTDNLSINVGSKVSIMAGRRKVWKDIYHEPDKTWNGKEPAWNEGVQVSEKYFQNFENECIEKITTFGIDIVPTISVSYIF